VRRLVGSEMCIRDRFININSLHEQEVAKKAREMGIDIAIDLAGITAENRHAIFGYRPAPIQVNYLGFMGTIGDNTEDYIIADAVTIPADLKKYYYEKVVTLPSFLPFDDTVGGEKKLVTRKEVGLPEQGFIFACFNPGVKITPPVFDSWMRILKAVPHSYLWLSPRNSIAEVNLRQEAQKRGIATERIIIAPKIRDIQFHLARQKLIDLFLDTYPYNAHTMAADALWSGALLLTRTGESMPSRVAASILTAVGLSELITTTAEAYEAKAIDLATHPEKLAVLKATLAKNRLTSPLFNSKLYAQHFEAALMAMYERYQADLPPDHIEIKA
jgi:protein O-GlcNAc transferase